MRERAGILLLMAVAMGAGTVHAQSFWLEKEYGKWSAEECRKLLEDSPWAKLHVLGRVYIELLSAPPDERGRERNPRLEYRVQLRSALPVRQALVRREQLETQYDKMTPEQRQGFDQQAAEFLGVKFPETVVMYVEYTSNVPAFATDWARHWQSQTTELVKNSIFLVGPRGERIPPSKFTAVGGAGGAFQLTFPRQIEGRALVSATDKELMLEFPHPNIGEQGASRVLIVFNVAKMVVGGTLMY